MSDYREIDTITQLLGLITEPGAIDRHVFQNIDFTELAVLASESSFTNCLFFMKRGRAKTATNPATRGLHK